MPVSCMELRRGCRRFEDLILFLISHQGSCLGQTGGRSFAEMLGLEAGIDEVEEDGIVKAG